MTQERGNRRRGSVTVRGHCPQRTGVLRRGRSEGGESTGACGTSFCRGVEGRRRYVSGLSAGPPGVEAFPPEVDRLLEEAVRGGE